MEPGELPEDLTVAHPDRVDVVVDDAPNRAPADVAAREREWSGAGGRRACGDRASGDRAFQWLLAPVSPARFYEQWWERRVGLVLRPLSREYYTGWFGRADVDKLLRAGVLRYGTNIDVVRYSAVHGGARETLNGEGVAGLLLWQGRAGKCGGKRGVSRGSDRGGEGAVAAAAHCTVSVSPPFAPFYLTALPPHALMHIHSLPYPHSALPYPHSALPYPHSALPYPHSALPYPHYALPYPYPTLLSPIPTLLSPIPTLLSPIPTLLSPIPTLLSPIPTLLSPIPTLLSPIPTLLSPIPTLLSPIPTLLSPIPSLHCRYSFACLHLFFRRGECVGIVREWVLAASAAPAALE
ncbi:unnamed protein product [Closterium sp. Naga37s-1]|nr:unnamed protein product [Closterium sp. Naga37s-1]